MKPIHKKIEHKKSNKIRSSYSPCWREPDGDRICDELHRTGFPLRESDIRVPKNLETCKNWNQYKNPMT